MGKVTKPVINLEGLPNEPVWYTVTTKYNCEHSAIADVVVGIEANNLEEKIVDWVVPIKETTVITTTKTGKEKEKIVKEKMYPNYTFVKAIMDEQVWDYLRQRNGVATILAPGGTPVWISEEEIERVRKHCGLNKTITLNK